MAKPDAVVTYGSSRPSRELTGLGAVNQFVGNAQTDYLDMLAKQEAQQKANAQPVGGTGLAKLNEAIANSPQLQSGLMAAGLSLMFGNDMETAVTAGFGAASNINQQVQQAEESTKAQLLAGAKQQSQMEHSYEQGNQLQRLPDNFNVQAARINAGTAERMMGLDYLKMVVANAQAQQDNAIAAGLAPAPWPVAFASAGGNINERARKAGVTIPGVSKLGEDEGTTNRVAPSVDQLAFLRYYRDNLTASGTPPAQVDALVMQQARNRGLGMVYMTAPALYAALDAPGTPTPKKAEPTKPSKGNSPAPAKKPAVSSSTSLDAAMLTKPKAETGPRVDQKARDKKAAEAEKQRLLYQSLLPQTQSDLDRLFQYNFR